MELHASLMEDNDIKHTGDRLGNTGIGVDYDKLSSMCVYSSIVGCNSV